MDPLDHMAEKILFAKKGREHHGERWQLVILLGEGRLEKFMCMKQSSFDGGGGGGRWHVKLQRFASRFFMRRCFASRLRTEVRVHEYLHEKCSLKSHGLFLFPFDRVGSFCCLSPHKIQKHRVYKEPLFTTAMCYVYSHKDLGFGPRHFTISIDGPDRKIEVVSLIFDITGSCWPLGRFFPLLHQDLMEAIRTWWRPSESLDHFLKAIQPLGRGISFQAWTVRAENIFTATICWMTLTGRDHVLSKQTQTSK